ncbi:MAG TPA: hypothetical protein VLS96_00455 [Nodosilinea sp.]|nr:hypothetical protein [Nodosilinea sp.]
MTMHRSVITAALAAGLLGSLGLAMLGQASQAETTLAQQQPQRPDSQGPNMGRGRSHGQWLTEAATQLGVSETELRAALGLPAEPPQRPDLATAAAQLGVSEADLQSALRSARGAMRCGQGEPAPAAE